VSLDHFDAGMHIIMVPPQLTIIGVPADIIFIMDSQRSRSVSMLVPSSGIILQIMPSLPISMVILHIMGMPIIGIIPIMGIIIMLPIMLGIIMPIRLGAMPIMLGVMPIMLGIIIIMLGIMPGIIALWDIGIAGMFTAGIIKGSSLVIASFGSKPASATSQDRLERITRFRPARAEISPG
jgi:hypothetical protein